MSSDKSAKNTGTRHKARECALHLRNAHCWPGAHGSGIAGLAGSGGHIRLEGDAAEGGMVRIRIRDHGSGIAPEHLQAAFDPFFTTKGRGEGTGLGLPIAASIVRNHGGQIDLASAPGTGTTATVLWPSIGERREAHA